MADADPDVLHLLAVEDDPTDQSWLMILLEQSSVCPYHISFAPTMGDAEVSLGVGEVDCVLLDLSLPDSWGLESLKRILAAAPEVPVVVITGSEGHGLGLQAIESGAHDYLNKAKVTGDAVLEAAQWAAARARALRARQRTESPLTALASPWVTVNHEAKVTAANTAMAELLGRDAADLVGRPFAALLEEPYQATVMRVLHTVISARSDAMAVPAKLEAADGAAAARIVTAVRVIEGRGPDSLLVVAAEPKPG
jgi:PAS domain S-box-containing protein